MIKEKHLLFKIEKSVLDTGELAKPYQLASHSENAKTHRIKVIQNSSKAEAHAARNTKFQALTGIHLKKGYKFMPNLQKEKDNNNEHIANKVIHCFYPNKKVPCYSNEKENCCGSILPSINSCRNKSEYIKESSTFDSNIHTGTKLKLTNSLLNARLNHFQLDELVKTVDDFSFLPSPLLLHSARNDQIICKKFRFHTIDNIQIPIENQFDKNRMKKFFMNFGINSIIGK